MRAVEHQPQIGVNVCTCEGGAGQAHGAHTDTKGKTTERGHGEARMIGRAALGVKRKTSPELLR